MKRRILNVLLATAFFSAPAWAQPPCGPNGQEQIFAVVQLSGSQLVSWANANPPPPLVSDPHRWVAFQAAQQSCGWQALRLKTKPLISFMSIFAPSSYVSGGVYNIQEGVSAACKTCVYLAEPPELGE